MPARPKSLWRSGCCLGALQNSDFPRKIPQFWPINIVSFTALNTSIVVLAQAHNPTILHPAFLFSEGIVPPDWEVEELPVSTPAFAIVKFSNQIVLTAEPQKFMVLDNAPGGAIRIVDVAVKYVEKLPHVHYSAVGVNFSRFVECPKAEQWLLNRFLKSGPGNDDKMQPKTVGLKLVYPIAGALCTLSLDAGSIKKGEVDVSCIAISGNYHVPIGPNGFLTATRNAIVASYQHLAHFSSLVHTIIEKGC